MVRGKIGAIYFDNHFLRAVVNSSYVRFFYTYLPAFGIDEISINNYRVGAVIDNFVIFQNDGFGDNLHFFGKGSANFSRLVMKVYYKVVNTYVDRVYNATALFKTVGSIKIVQRVGSNVVFGLDNITVVVICRLSEFKIKRSRSKIGVFYASNRDVVKVKDERAVFFVHSVDFTKINRPIEFKILGTCLYIERSERPSFAIGTIVKTDSFVHKIKIFTVATAVCGNNVG